MIQYDTTRHDTIRSDMINYRCIKCSHLVLQFYKAPKVKAKVQKSFKNGKLLLSAEQPTSLPSVRGVSPLRHLLGFGYPSCGSSRDLISRRSSLEGPTRNVSNGISRNVWPSLKLPGNLQEASIETQFDRPRATTISEERATTAVAAPKVATDALLEVTTDYLY